MRVLLFMPRGRFNYKAPYVPLGILSIATYLKEHGHVVSVADRSFEKEAPDKTIASFCPDIVCVSLVSMRLFDDAIVVSNAAKKAGKPVVWGGMIPSDYFRTCLEAGYADYISIGEGEINILNLITALETGSPVEEVRGIAFLKDGKAFKTDIQPVADLAELPIIDFSLCDPNRYIHSYMCCKRMMYLYCSKGCTSHCTFCSNPAFHCNTYRMRPVEYVIQEIRYLYDNFNIDGVYFSDECWYINRKYMREFCRRLEEENISIYWGCELRCGMYTKEDFEYMYAHGLRWVMLGLETGDPDMLKTIKKGITVEQIRRSVSVCKAAGITTMVTFIVGYPDETPEQLQNTLDLLYEIQATISACNIFTPIPNTEITDELEKKGEYVLSDSASDIRKTLTTEYSPYRCKYIPQRDLKVIRSCFMWKVFTSKSVSDSSKHFEIARNSIIDTWNNIRRYGIANLIPALFLTAANFLPIFWYAHFYPGTKRKYRLEQLSRY